MQAVFYTSRGLVAFSACFSSFRCFTQFLIHYRNKLKFSVFLNLTADFLAKSAENAHLKNERADFLTHKSDKLRFWSGLYYHSKRGIVRYFHAYSRLVKFFEHCLLSGPFFCPVKLSGLFLFGKKAVLSRENPSPASRDGLPAQDGWGRCTAQSPASAFRRPLWAIGRTRGTAPWPFLHLLCRRKRLLSLSKKSAERQTFSYI